MNETWIFRVEDEHGLYGGCRVKVCRKKAKAEEFAIQYAKEYAKVNVANNFYFDFDEIGEDGWIDRFDYACNTWYGDSYEYGGRFCIDIYEDVIH
jgi:hypothetical protein